MLSTLGYEQFLSPNVVRLQQVEGRKRQADLKEYHSREKQPDDPTEDSGRNDHQRILDNVADTTLQGQT